MAKTGFSVPKNIGYSGVPCSYEWGVTVKRNWGHISCQQGVSAKSLESGWMQGLIFGTLAANMGIRIKTQGLDTGIYTRLE